MAYVSVPVLFCCRLKICSLDADPWFWRELGTSLDVDVTTTQKEIDNIWEAMARGNGHSGPVTSYLDAIAGRSSLTVEQLSAVPAKIHYAEKGSVQAPTWGASSMGFSLTSASASIKTGQYVVFADTCGTAYKLTSIPGDPPTSNAFAVVGVLTPDDALTTAIDEEVVGATVNMATAGLAAAGSLAFFFDDYEKAAGASCDPGMVNLAAAGRRRLMADSRLIIEQPELLRLAQLPEQQRFFASDLFMGARLWDEGEEAAYAQSLHERGEHRRLGKSAGKSDNTGVDGTAKKDNDDVPEAMDGDDWPTGASYCRGPVCFEAEPCKPLSLARVCVVTWTLDLGSKGVFKTLADQLDVGVEASFGFGMLGGNWSAVWRLQTPPA